MQVRSGLVRRLIAGLALAAALLVAVFLLAGKSATAVPLNRIYESITLGPGRDASQTGGATLIGGGSPTEVVIQIEPGPPGVRQPANIHAGPCPDVGEVVYPLNSIVDGTSTTTIDVTLRSLFDGNFAINVQESEAEIDVYVSCGDIRSESHTMSEPTIIIDPGFGGPREVTEETSLATPTPSPAPTPTTAPTRTPEPSGIPTSEPAATPLPTLAAGDPADGDGVSPFWFVLAALAVALVLVGGGAYFIRRYRT